MAWATTFLVSANQDGGEEIQYIMSTQELSGRVALVTGATRRIGIGAAICRALAADGADIVFTHWLPYDRVMYASAGDDPDRLCVELRALGVRAESIEVDMSAPDAPERILDEAEARMGTLSILINNAAYSTNDGYEALDAATLDAHYAVNMRAAMLLSVGFARRFAGTGGGRIIHMTSGQSRGPMPGELAYGATKGAIEAFTVSLADAVAAQGITVNAVNPGPTDTGWMSDDLKQALLGRFPTGRIGQPDDAARLIAFLAGDDAAWITGQIIHSEGGFRRS